MFHPKDLVPQPVHKRHSIRLLGKHYYTLRRYQQWYWGNKRLSKTHIQQPLEHELIAHSSVLLRQLPGVDMQLQHNKATNLQVASNRITGIVMRPQETFSFWYLVGRPSRRRGYKVGLTLWNGAIRSGYGGGLCQLGNLLFWMALHTPLRITERWRHSFDVFPDVNRTLPFGSGATLAYNYIDLQITNPTDYCFQINLWLTESHLHGSLCSDTPIPYAYTVYEKHHCMRQQAWGGYTRHNQLYRHTHNTTTGALIADELMVENHAIMMYTPLLSQPS